MAEIDLSAFSNVVPLGSGGLGDVYRAVRRSTGGEVAIKVLRDWSDQDTSWQRTQRELRALVHLKGHGNVVNIEEVIETDGAMAIVMEYAPGGAVSDLLRERGTLGFADVLLVATHTAAALSASHDRGIIHRDIKPHNLLIDAFGQVKVCDFGIAALTRSDEVSNRTSALSLRYASPEELRGDPDIGPPADVYSLAATTHQLLTGRYLPIPDGTPESAPLLGWTAPPEVPAPVAETFRSLITRAADRTASERPTAAALHDQLDILSGQLGPLRSRSLPLAVPEFDDATQVRSVSITGPTDTQPPAVPNPPTPEPPAESHTVILGNSAAPRTTPESQPAAVPVASAAPAVDPPEDSPDRPVRRTFVAVVVVALAAAAAAALYVAGVIGSAEEEPDGSTSCVDEECIVVTGYATTTESVVIDYVTSEIGEPVELHWTDDPTLDVRSMPAATWTVPASGIGRKFVAAAMATDAAWMCLVAGDGDLTTCVPALEDGWTNDRADELAWVDAFDPEDVADDPADDPDGCTADSCTIVVTEYITNDSNVIIDYVTPNAGGVIELHWSSDPEVAADSVPADSWTASASEIGRRAAVTTIPDGAAWLCLVAGDADQATCVPALEDGWINDRADELAWVDAFGDEGAG